MKAILYKKENNLFQSNKWLSFQEKYSRKIVKFSSCSGIQLNLPFSKSFIWVQKGPNKVNIEEIKKVGKGAGVIFVRVEPECVDKEEMKKVGVRSLLSGQASPRATQVLDLGKSEEEILSKMKSKTRYNIRLSEKKGVKVKKVDNADVLYTLLVKTAERDKGYSPHEKNYYQEMMNSFKDSGSVHIFVAEDKEEPLAAILVSFYGDVATYLHGGFDDTKRNLMAPYLCQWEAIKYAKEKGCKYYDFWGVAETDNTNNPWSGITRFKEGFGGEKVIFPGSYDIVISKFWYNILTFGAKLKHLFKR